MFHFFPNIYLTPVVYRAFIYLIYGINAKTRYEEIAKLVPDGSSVVDVCCGDCRLNYFLEKKRIHYLGLDINPQFINYALRRGIKAELFDLEKEIVPIADYVIMQGSLYHFIPKVKVIMDKLFDASKKAVIISESIIHATYSKNFIFSFLATQATSVKGKTFPQRFTKRELLNLFDEYGVDLIKEIEGTRDIIGVFHKS